MIKKGENNTCYFLISALSASSLTFICIFCSFWPGYFTYHFSFKLGFILEERLLVSKNTWNSDCFQNLLRFPCILFANWILQKPLLFSAPVLRDVCSLEEVFSSLVHQICLCISLLPSTRRLTTHGSFSCLALLLPTHMLPPNFILDIIFGFLILISYLLCLFLLED